MENFKNQFYLAALFQFILDNSSKSEATDDIFIFNERLCFDDRQKDAMESLIGEVKIKIGDK